METDKLTYIQKKILKSALDTDIEVRRIDMETYKKLRTEEQFKDKFSGNISNIELMISELEEMRELFGLNGEIKS